MESVALIGNRQKTAAITMLSASHNNGKQMSLIAKNSQQCRSNQANKITKGIGNFIAGARYIL